MVVKPHANSKSVIGWLPCDRPVVVLSIRFAPSIGSQYTIWSETQKSVALFPSSEFEILNSELPNNWRAVLDLNGNVELIPMEWTMPHFWDEYNEGNPTAIKLFNKVTKHLTDIELQ